MVDKDGKIVKYEALMRLREEEGGIVSFVSPLEFLEVASKTKHYNQISEMMLLKSLDICARVNEPISLNLNYQDILNKSLHEKLKKAILHHDIGKKVIFEIVESQNIQSYKLLQNFIAEFKTYGVRFAIDDFGTGFSNFTHIFELSPDFIKIDGSLIKNIHVDKKSYELVKAIVFFSKELGIQTIAEFVHAKEVFDITLKLGIDQFQGYYFSEPKEEI
ncbi:MAG: EAL domain-containing protein [Sulfurospirillaceae bacterium]|nr:EAL domain-containing protein [Sulfurospirillaceae bacterium]